LFIEGLKARIFAYATMEDSYFSSLVSPAVTSLRLADGFVRNVLILLSGTTVAMIIPIIASPLLTRLYTPHDFGVFALFVSLVTAASVPIAGSYESAILLPRKDEDAFNLVGVCLGLSLAIGSALLLLLLLLKQPVASFLGSREIAAWLPFVSPVTFLLGLQQTFTCWANRKKQFRRLSVNRIVESATTPILSMLLGYLSWGVSGLVAGLLGGKVAATWMLGRGVRLEKKKYTLSLETRGMVVQGKKYRDFPLYSAPTSFLDVLAVQIPVLLLTTFFGSTVVGLFSLATKVIGAPLALIGSCVGQVYYQWVAQARHQDDNLHSHIFKVAGYLALIVAGPLLVVIIFSPVLFSFVFGEEWRVAGEYARIVAVPLSIKFIVSPLSSIMPASGNIRLGSLWKLIYFSSTAVALYAASQFTAKTFLYVYSANEAILYAIYFILIVKASDGLRVHRPSVARDRE
jgi:O-antigen/teichoic acid export membrane protein